MFLIDEITVCGNLIQGVIMKTIRQILLSFFILLVVSEFSSATAITVNSTIAVNPFADDGLCTLPEAIQASNQNQASGNLPGECSAGQSHPDIDIIDFSIDILPAVFAVETALLVTESVHVLGAHKDLVTISGIGLDRVIEIIGLPGQQYLLSDFTLSGGYAPVGPPPTSVGGGMLVSLTSASLQIERLRFENNNAEYAGGAMAIGYGGTQGNQTTILQTEFINNSSIGSVTQINDNHGGGGAVFIGGYQTVDIKQSTFADNQALNTTAPLPTGDGMGGAIWILSSSSLATSSLTIDSSTFDGNTANGAGGAVSVGGPGFQADSSLVDIKHSTIIGNAADNNQSNTGNAGGGIFSSADTPVNIFNNVLARNRDFSISSRNNISGQFNTFGHNYLNGNDGIGVDFPSGSPNVNNDFVLPAIGMPDLAPLADNGGPTLTRAIDVGSPLIDQGKCANADTDQRGFQNANNLTRADNDISVINFVDGCDIGAFETGTYSENAEPAPGQEAYTLLEDELLIVNDFDGTLTPADTSDDGLLVNDVDDDPLWVTNAGVYSLQGIDMTQPGDLDLKANGTLTFSPAANEHGNILTQYTVSDRFNQQSLLFGIYVLPVNDAPEFVVDGSTSFGFGDLAELIEYENWAIDINAGADNEDDQALVFDLLYVQGNDSFFDVVPSIDASGELVFDVADNADGTVEMQVFLSDDGGTENGGEDTSTGVTVTFSRSPSDVIFNDSFEASGGS